MKLSCGYIFWKVKPGNEYYPMAGKSGYVAEHRLVVAQHLGRCLKKFEIVHHKNHIRSDNRRENLELISGYGARHTHESLHLRDERLKLLEAYINSLELEIKTLRWELAYSNSRDPIDSDDWLERLEKE